MNHLEVRLCPEQMQELVQGIAHELRQQQAPPKLAYSIVEAAELTSSTEWCIRTAIHRGELHAKQAGSRGAYSIPRDSLMAWL